jgi:hypothetical protein
VFGCSPTKGDIPAAILQANVDSFFLDLNLFLFARPSTGISTPGPVAVADWWGDCNGNLVVNRQFNTKTGLNLLNMGCLGKTVTLNKE